MQRDGGYIRYTGTEQPNLEFHDGGLRPAVGVWNVQVFRANREHPEMADGIRNTYNHAPNLTWWKGKFYIAWLSNPIHEHLGAGQTFFCTSVDALSWEKPQVLFPPYPLNLAIDNGPHSDLFEENNAWACMHQRMNFYISSKGRLIAVGFYGISPEVFTMPCMGYGIGRVAREVYEDGGLGPIHMVVYSTKCGYNTETCIYPYYKESNDSGFIDAIDELLADKLTTLQWWEENRDYPNDDLFSIRGAGEAFNYYRLADGRLVGLWKKSRVSISEDDGNTWQPVQTSPSLVMSGGKVWGERTSDGRYALCYNPNTDSCHRWPLAVTTSEDGIEFSNMLCVHGEVPRQRYWGFWRDFGPNYIRGLEANAVTPDGAMYLTYSVNKEDIWVCRVPVPITGKVLKHYADDFASMSPRKYIPGWNVYSGLWSRVSLETVKDSTGMRKNAIRLRSKDPYDNAVAMRVFPESEKVKIKVGILARQNYFGRLEIDLTDNRGVCVCRAILDNDRTIKLKHGNGFSVVCTYGGLINLIWNVDCVAREVVFAVNEEQTVTCRFFNSASKVERLVFRTGKKERRPYLEEDKEFETAKDLPGAGTPLIQEAVYYIHEFSTEAAE